LADISSTTSDFWNNQKKERKLASQLDDEGSVIDLTVEENTTPLSYVKCEQIAGTTVSFCASPTIIKVEKSTISSDYISPYEGEAEWDEDLYSSKYDSSSDPEDEVDTLVDSDSDDSLAFSQMDSSDFEVVAGVIDPGMVCKSFNSLKELDVDRRALRKAELKVLFDVEQQQLEIVTRQISFAHAVRESIVLSKLKGLSEKESTRCQAFENDKATVLAEGESAAVDLVLHHKQVIAATDNAFQHHCTAIQTRQEAFAFAEEAGEIVACMMSGQVRPENPTRRAALICENEIEMETLVKFGRSDLAKLRVRQLTTEKRQRLNFMSRVEDMEHISSIVKEAHIIEMKILAGEGMLDAKRTKMAIEKERVGFLEKFLATLSADDVILFNE
jgi:hypothetical protein